MRKIPTHLKLLRGNPGKRAIAPEPEPTAVENLPEPPEFLGDDARNEWWRVVPELKALGLLTILDLSPLAAYCEAYGRWVCAERLLAAMAAKDPVTHAVIIKGTAGSAMTNPLVKVSRCAAADMVAIASEFGMTPRARSYLATSGRTGGPSKFDGLIS